MAVPMFHNEEAFEDGNNDKLLRERMLSYMELRRLWLKYVQMLRIKLKLGVLRTYLKTK
jgi:hypothetical protein